MAQRARRPLSAPAMAMDRAVRRFDIKGVRRLDQALAPLWDLFKAQSSLRVIYAAAKAMGLCPHAPPPPILPLRRRSKPESPMCSGRSSRLWRMAEGSGERSNLLPGAGLEFGLLEGATLRGIPLRDTRVRRGSPSVAFRSRCQRPTRVVSAGPGGLLPGGAQGKGESSGSVPTAGRSSPSLAPLSREAGGRKWRTWSRFEHGG